MCTVRCFIILVVLFDITYCDTAKTSTEWSERKPYCPAKDTETHKCSSLETRQDTCIRREKCCDDDSSSSSSEDSDDCRFCDKTVTCEQYKCNTQCCEGFHETTNGQCIHNNPIFCKNGGTLEQHTDGLQMCRCPDGFRGFECEKPKCDCENNGECTTKGGKPFCECKNGFSGDKCKIKIIPTKNMINRPITRAIQRDNTIRRSASLHEVTTVVSIGSKEKHIHETEKVALADMHEHDREDHVNIGVIAGVICGIIIVVVISGVVIWRCRRGQKATLDRDMSLEQTCSSFEKKAKENSLNGAASPMLERTENIYDKI